MKYTLLDLVQTILSSMESDEVNSIDDTIESQAVTRIVRDTYFEIISRDRLPEHYNLFALDASGDNAKPTVMYKPADVRTLDWVKYDVQTADDAGQIRFVEVKYLALQDFLDMMYRLNSTDDNVDAFTLSVATPTDGNTVFNVLARNDIHPTYYTSFDDGTILFDAYDSEIDSTLQKDKTLAYGVQGVTWSNTDTFVPQLAEVKFPLLLNEAKALAFAELKQTAHQEAGKRAMRAWVSSQKNASAIPGVQRATDKLPNYGRH